MNRQKLDDKVEQLISKISDEWYDKGYFGIPENDPDMIYEVAYRLLTEANLFHNLWQEARVAELEKLSGLANELDAADDDATWESPHPIFQMAQENDNLRARVAELEKIIDAVKACKPFNQTEKGKLWVHVHFLNKALGEVVWDDELSMPEVSDE